MASTTVGLDGKALKALLRKSLEELRITPYLRADGSSVADGGLMRVSSLAGICAREEVLCSRLKRTRSEQIKGDLGLIFETGNGLHWGTQNRLLTKAQMILGRWLCASCGHVTGAQHEWELPLPPEFREVQLFRPGKCPSCDTILTSDNCLYQEQEFVDWVKRIAGHPDGFLRVDGMPGLGLLEAKSINPRDGWRVRQTPKLDHVVQNQTYQWMTGCRWGLVLYWVKDGGGLSSIIPHIIDYDDDHVEAIQNLIDDVWRGVEDPDSRLPERICPHDEVKRAELCSASVECFKEAD